MLRNLHTAFPPSLLCMASLPPPLPTTAFSTLLLLLQEVDKMTGAKAKVLAELVEKHA